MAGSGYANGETLVSLVFRMVVFNLESQKIMDRLQSVAILSFDQSTDFIRASIGSYEGKGTNAQCRHVLSLQSTKRSLA